MGRLENLRKKLENQQDNLSELILKKDDDIRKLKAETNKLKAEIIINVNQLVIANKNNQSLQDQLTQMGTSPEQDDLTGLLNEKNAQILTMLSDRSTLKKDIQFYSIFVEKKLKRREALPFFLPGESLSIRLDNVTGIKKRVDFSYGFKGVYKYKVNGLSVGDSIARELEGKIFIFKIISSSTNEGETATIKVTRVLSQTEIT